MKQNIIYFWYRFIGVFFRIFPIKNNRVLFSNFFGKGYGDNPKYIAEELLKLKKENLELVWLVKNNYLDFPIEIKQVKRGTFKELYYLSTSKIWVDNSRKHNGIKKRKKQFYIQTWHGCVGFKKCENLVKEKLSKQYVLSAKNDSKMADVFISNSDFCTKNYLDNFWYDGYVLKCGSPRNDIIINNDIDASSRVKQYYNIVSDTKICLYAPTFRDNGNIDAYDIDFKLVKKSLEKRFGGNWIIMIRLHPNISDLSSKLILDSNVIDVTEYPDMQELLTVSDFMITDYSSCIFDYSISLKPGIIYASDIEEYTKERDFLINLKNTPFNISKNNEELNDVIINFDEKKYQKRVNDFNKRIDLYEPGTASKTIADLIIKKINEGK